jgi:hypothetical protein
VTVIDLSGLFAWKLTVMIIGSDVSMHDTRRDISEPRLCRASCIGAPPIALTTLALPIRVEPPDEEEVNVLLSAISPLTKSTAVRQAARIEICGLTRWRLILAWAMDSMADLAVFT